MRKPRKRRADSALRAGIVLDAGALVALERRAPPLLVRLAVADAHGVPIRIPAGALAQVWRGGPRSAPIARLLRQDCKVVHLDERAARDIGELLAALPRPSDAKPDIVDAHVALITCATGSQVWTSDPDDIAGYGVPQESIRVV